MSRETDLDFIKEFSKINISTICKELKVDRANLLNGRASEEKTKLVKEEILKRLESLCR